MQGGIQYSRVSLNDLENETLLALTVTYSLARPELIFFFLITIGHTPESLIHYSVQASPAYTWGGLIVSQCTK